MTTLILIFGIIGFIGLCLIGWSMLLESDGEYYKSIKFLDIGATLIVIWAIAMIVLLFLSLYILK